VPRIACRVSWWYRSADETRVTTTTFLATPALVNKEFQDWCDRADELWIASAWASRACPSSSALWLARKKIRALVVGLDFLQTDPGFLARFREHARVSTEGATFHPKVYLFRAGRRFACMLGSSNFTAGGFGSNVEANIVIRGGVGEPLFKELRERVCALFEYADVLAPDLLRDYAVKHRAKARAVEQLRHYVPSAVVLKELSERRKRGGRATATTRTLFLAALRKLPNGRVLSGAAAQLLNGVEVVPVLRVRWNPHGFTITCSPSGGVPIHLGIVENCPHYQGLGVVQGLMQSQIERATRDSALALRAYDECNRLVPKFLRSARRSSQGNSWGIRLGTLAGDEQRATELLTTMAQWLSAEMP
jgi:PLD-like domain